MSENRNSRGDHEEGRRQLIDVAPNNATAETSSTGHNEHIGSVSINLNAEYRVCRNMDALNRNKTGVFAFVWNMARDTYSAKRQNHETFKQYKYVMLEKNASIVHRFKRGKVLSPNQVKEVIIGKHFDCGNARNEWDEFKMNNKYLLFGIDFTNKTMVEFRLLNENDLRLKYVLCQKMDEENSDLSEFSKDEKSKMLYWLSTFRDLQLSSADDCLNRCFVENIWTLYEKFVEQCNSRKDDVARMLRDLRV